MGSRRKRFRRFQHRLGETAVVARVYNTAFSTERYYYEVEEDPLSLLLGYGEKAKPGEWLGDAIGVSNQRPEGFFRIPRIYLKYYPYYHNSCTLSRRMVRRMPKSKESIAVYPAEKGKTPKNTLSGDVPLA